MDKFLKSAEHTVNSEIAAFPPCLAQSYTYCFPPCPNVSLPKFMNSNIGLDWSISIVYMKCHVIVENLLL